MDQLTQIMKVTGVPGHEFIQKLDSLEVGHDITARLCVCHKYAYIVKLFGFFGLVWLFKSVLFAHIFAAFVLACDVSALNNVIN